MRRMSQKIRVAEEAAQFCTPQYRAPELYEPVIGSAIDARCAVRPLVVMSKQSGSCPSFYH